MIITATRNGLLESQICGKRKKNNLKTSFFWGFCGVEVKHPRNHHPRTPLSKREHQSLPRDVLCRKVMYRRMQQEQTSWHAVIKLAFSRARPPYSGHSYTHLPKPCLPSVPINDYSNNSSAWIVAKRWNFSDYHLCFLVFHQPRLLYRLATDFTCLSVQSPDGCDARNLADTRSKHYSGACWSSLSQEVGLRVFCLKKCPQSRV